MFCPRNRFIAYFNSNIRWFYLYLERVYSHKAIKLFINFVRKLFRGFRNVCVVSKKKNLKYFKTVGKSLIKNGPTTDSIFIT